MVKLTYKSKLKKSGIYSFNLTIPKGLIKALNLKEDEEVYLQADEGDNKIVMLRKNGQ